ncbi:MAG TPA: aminotransferase class IV [Puia sp.]|nr:aminotransferase class IV [Puia sp.]
MSTSPLWINVDGNLLAAGTPFLSAGSRAFRYGDGLFETMLVQDHRIRLGPYHFDRLSSGMLFLRFHTPPGFTPERLTHEILELCNRNGHARLSRVRLVIFRTQGEIFDPAISDPHYVIESWPLPESPPELNPQGLVIDVFPQGRKACDPLANLKSNNYLLYLLAARYAGEHGLGDCLVLNTRETVADTAIANVFYFRAGRCYTPPLTDAGVAGVMRRHLLASMPAAGFEIEERTVTIQDLLAADEVFLTNAIRGIRWVAAFRETRYKNSLTTALYHKLFK